MAESTEDLTIDPLTPVEVKPVEGLVEVTFPTRNGEVAREVYPEIAKFITSRRESEIAYQRERSLRQRERQQYIWEKEDEWYADSSHGSNSFDDYQAGREWDRGEGHGLLAEAEHRHNDFMQGYQLNSAARIGRGNPNSWEILRREAQAAGHKMVVWLVDNCLENEHEASILVRYLPATVEELWAIAKEDNDMCNVFDRYMERAERAGLFKEDDIPASLREQRALRSWVTRSFGGNYSREITTRLKPILRAEREDAVTKARAAWDKELLEKFASSQDMSELLRSLADGHPLVQQHLNRSDAAKAAWERRRAQEDQASVERVAEEVTSN